MAGMTAEALAEHLEKIHMASQDDWDEFLEDLFEPPYPDPCSQEN